MERLRQKKTVVFVAAALLFLLNHCGLSAWAETFSPENATCHASSSTSKAPDGCGDEDCCVQAKALSEPSLDLRPDSRPVAFLDPANFTVLSGPLFESQTVLRGPSPGLFPESHPVLTSPAHGPPVFPQA
jgi:hypothetical protein